MDLINNRFRVLNQLEQNNLYTSYLVNDLWEDKKLLQLNIINLNNTPRTIIDYFSDEFIKFKNFNNNYLVNIYNFNVISYVDNKKAIQEQFFYTCDYIKKSIKLLEFIKNKSISNIIKFFVEICKIFNLIHLKGHIYKTINLNNLFIVKSNNNYYLKIKDIATKELESKSYLSDNYNNRFFVSPIKLNRQQYDIYSLGAILLSLLKKDCNFNSTPQEELFDFYKNISKYKFNKKDVEIINKLKSFLLKVLSINNENYPYNTIYQLILDLNKIFKTNYEFNYQNDLNKVNYHLKIIGRDNEINKVLENYNNMICYNSYTKVFLIKGEMGTGKTRILEELKFRLELRKANIYYSFHLNDLNESNDKMWEDILRKLILDTENDIIQKYQNELIRFFPEIIEKDTHYKNKIIEEHQTKYRLLNRIISFIDESINNKSTVFIIDNIDLADEFTLDAFTYLFTKLVKKRNIMLILSYNENYFYKNKKFPEFLFHVNQYSHCETINIKNLNNQNSGEFIKNMLDMSYIPIRLTNKIFSKSYGNPLFISEIIKDLYNRKILYVNKKTGLWHIDIPNDDGEYKLLIIPNSIEQTVLNQLKDLDDVSKNILNIMSIFPNSISLNKLNYVIKRNDLYFYIQKLTNKGIISKVNGTSDNVYTINNKVLKDIVYDKIPIQDKIDKHLLVAKELENKNEDEKNYLDLIYHYECANNNKKVIKYSLKYAEKMHEEKNFLDELRSLKKALSYIDNKNDKINLLIKISKLYYTLGNDNEAIIYLNKAEKEVNNINNFRQLIDINLYSGKIAINVNDYEECKIRLQKAQKLLQNYNNLELQLDCKHLEAYLRLYEKKFDESSKILWEIIDKCDVNYPLIEADCYRLLAYIYSTGNKISEALNLFNKALKLFESTNHIRGILICLNNIGTIYSDVYQNINKALKYYNKVKDISEEYEAEIYEIIALINIACQYETSYDYELSYIHFKQSLDKSLRGNFFRQVFFTYQMLTKTCLNLNYYSEAYRYNKLAQEMITKSPNQGLDIIEFYKSSGDLYYTFGEFETAQKYIIKSIEFYKSGINYEQFLYIILSKIINLRLKPFDSYEDDIIEILLTSKKFISTEMKIEALSNAAIILGERKDYKNAKLLINEMKISLPKEIHDVTLTKYYLALGINDTTDEQLKYLLNALELAKKLKNKVILTNILIFIGNYYFAKQDYLYSVEYYLEAWELLKLLITDIPKKYKLSFINNNNYTKIYSHIKHIYNILTNNIDKNYESNNLLYNFQINNLEELETIINDDIVMKFKSNTKFMQFYSLQFTKKLPKPNFNKIDILNYISNNTTNNIQLILKYLASVTFSTNGYIIVETNNEYKTITSLNDNDKYFTNFNIIEKAKVTTKPLLISKNNINHNINYQDINNTACLCIPIVNNTFQDYFESINNNIIGYLYLESDRIIHNINENGLQKCKELLNILYLLIEKHQLKLDASIDKLTDTLTRKYLEETIQKIISISSKEKSHFSIIMYDIDNFKNINDRFGHQTGDEVLASISKLIIDNLNTNDFIGRYGGEEFIIILPNKNQDEALLIANDLRVKIHESKILGNKADITVSMGIASYPNHGQTIEELFEKADQALYISKENGKNCCNVWTNKYSYSKIKNKDPLTGIISGNFIKDSRNVLTIIELIELLNKNISYNDKIYQFLGRTIELIEAYNGYLFIIDKNLIIKKYGRQSQKENWLTDFNINKKMLTSAIKNKQGSYLVDWDDLGKSDLITGIPDWNSILINPIIEKNEVKAVLYYTVSTKIKEFSNNEFNFINVLSNLIPAIIK